MGKQRIINTFQSVFGDGGNIAEINLDWQCEKCEKDLKFRLVAEDGIDDIQWEAICCNTIYTITPYTAAYNKDIIQKYSEDAIDEVKEILRTIEENRIGV